METPKPPHDPPDDEELDELPPIDGDEVDGEEADDGTGEDLDDEPDDGGDPMDDSTGEGDPVDEELDAAGDESGWLDGADDSETLDVGTPDTFGAEDESPTLLEGAEEADLGEDELPLETAEGGSLVGDAGEEGFEDEEEALREEDLPRLDSGADDVDTDDADLLDGLPELPEEDAPEELRPPWDDRAWERVDGAQPSAAVASRLSPRRAVAAAGTDEGARDVVSAGDDLWGRGASGHLLWSGDGGATWSRVLPERRFEAITADPTSGEVVALAREGVATTVARGAAGRVVVSSVGPLPEGEIRSLAAYDGRLAVALGRGAFQIEEGVWSRLDGTAGLTAMTYAGSGSLVIALHSEAEGRAWVLEARPGAPALTVAEVGEAPGSSADDDGDGARIRALSWDGAAGVVWAAGGFGVIALRPARR